MPFVVPAVHDTVALWSPLMADGLAGAKGTPAGVTGVEEAEELLVPFPLVAVTLKV